MNIDRNMISNKEVMTDIVICLDMVLEFPLVTLFQPYSYKPAINDKGNKNNW